MYKQKLCLSASKAYGISLTEQIKLFKKTGFEGFFVLWQKDMDEEIAECAKVAKEENMIFQSIHAPWGYAQDLWDENEKEDARKGVEELKHCLDLCKMFAVRKTFIKNPFCDHSSFLYSCLKLPLLSFQDYLLKYNKQVHKNKI